MIEDKYILLASKYLKKYERNTNVMRTHANAYPSKPLSFTEFLEVIGWSWIPFEIQKNMINFCQKKGVKGVIATRGIGKTELIVVCLTAYRIYQDSNCSSLLIGASYDSAKNWIEAIGNIIDSNPDLYADFHTTKIKITKVGSINKEPTVSIGTVNTNLRGKHVDYIIGDDWLTRENISKTRVKNVQKKYDEILSLNKGKNNQDINIVIIGNPVSQYDLYADLRKNEAIEVFEVWNDELPPEFQANLDDLRMLGMTEASISANYKGIVIPDEGSPFVDINKEKLIFDNYSPSVLFIDPSKKQGKDSDFTSICIVQQINERIGVVGFLYKKPLRPALEQFKDDVKYCNALAKVNNISIYYEDNILGDEGMYIINDILGASSSPINYSTKKEDRILRASTLSPYLVLNNEIINNDFNQQVITYGSSSIHDDAPDSLASALERLGIIDFKQTKAITSRY